ncbi:hypothetical protein BDV95DRAFT_632103 [Massariosphaeria phaeospora]|uniref:F-box domain-containing protein n=1 Tax=Massariosphaeria phaeospora TaxID=100035 RepID=A0A7C8MCL7_9PLEO|nr:hypothetical protein BDV95DRAFT_632103 [Massariosphaeria phaeospora]
MPDTLDRLPFDILFYIILHLDFDDLVSLAYTCKQLKTLLNENSICKKIIQTRFPYSKKAQLAQNQHISYPQAFNHIQDRRNAFSNAHPFSARIVGKANDFCYRQGKLCILKGNVISVLDSISKDVIINLSTISPGSWASSEELRLSLLFYNDDIVTVYCKKEGRPNNGHILAISIRPGLPDEDRLIKSIPLEDTRKLFARHTSQYLYYGTYSSVGPQGHDEWEIRGVSLDVNRTMPRDSLKLRGFFGTDVGSTIAFEIHNDAFCAVSNQTTFEVEEIDWTSFYHCIKFPLHDPTPAAMESNRNLWRRQHDEGVLQDSWTDLSLQIDEATHSLMIVEARREYQKTCHQQVRTFYISEFVSSPDSSIPSSEALTGLVLPWDDAYVATLDSTNNPNYARPEPRNNWNFHPEVPFKSNPNRSFLLARTKLRAYNYSCASFLDMVEDDRCCHLSESCLRLRIGSRRVAPLDWRPLEESMPERLSAPALSGDVAYRHSKVKMWPPPSSRCPCSKRLHQILNPPLPSGPAYNRSITGTLDEDNLVYMIRPGQSYNPSDDKALGIIVMTNFNQAALPPKILCSNESINKKNTDLSG